MFKGIKHKRGRREAKSPALCPWYSIGLRLDEAIELLLKLPVVPKQVGLQININQFQDI